MSRSGSNIDETGKILAGIRQQLHQLSLSGKRAENATKDLQEAVSGLMNECVGNLGSMSSVLQALHDVGLSAACRTHDIELVASEQRLPHFTSAVALTPISIAGTNYKVDATPTSAPQFSWKTPPLVPSRPDCLWMLSAWHTVISDHEENIQIKLELMFVVDPSKSYISFQLVSAPRFLTADFHSTDPVEVLPIDDRGPIRRQLYDQIADAISKQQVANPTIKADAIILPFHYCPVNLQGAGCKY